MNYIKDIYNARFRPATERFLQNSEYAELMNDIIAALDDLDKDLSERSKSKMKNIDALQNKLTTITAEENYASGFRDGARLMLDILIGKNENLTAMELNACPKRQ